MTYKTQLLSTRYKEELEFRVNNMRDDGWELDQDYYYKNGKWYASMRKES